MSVVEVRNGVVRGYLDGRLVCEWKTDYRNLGPLPDWPARNPSRLAVGSHGEATRFHAVTLTDAPAKAPAATAPSAENPEKDTP